MEKTSWYDKLKSLARYSLAYIVLFTCLKLEFGESYTWVQIGVSILIASLATED